MQCPINNFCVSGKTKKSRSGSLARHKADNSKSSLPRGGKSSGGTTGATGASNRCASTHLCFAPNRCFHAIVWMLLRCFFLLFLIIYLIKNWRWGNDTSKSSFVSGPLLPARPGDEAKQSPMGPLMCGAHLFIVCSAGGDRCNRASRTTSLCEEAVEDARQYSRSDTTFSN